MTEREATEEDLSYFLRSRTRWHKAKNKMIYISSKILDENIMLLVGYNLFLYLGLNNSKYTSFVYNPKVLKLC